MRKLTSIVYATASLLLAPVANAATFTLLHTFGSGTDAVQSQAQLTLVAGKLFGTSTRGGTNGDGTIFEYGLASGSERVVHSFTNGREGTTPRAPLLASGGMLYGTTYGGGPDNDGAAFQFDPATHKLRVLHVFGTRGTNDGANPIATVTRVGNIFLGTTLAGGRGMAGTVYEYDRDTGDYAIIAHDTYPKQKGPSGTLTSHHGLLYGLTVAGGDPDCDFCGTLYAVNPATGVSRIVHNFNGADGRQPQGALVSDGAFLYGVTYSGGTNNDGTVFKYDPTRATLTTLYNFTGRKSGAEPVIGLTSMGKILYGTTYSGGSNDNGIVFGIDKKTLKESVVYTFTGGNDGSTPFGLTAISGVLYGTTNGGGAVDAGTLYSLTP